MIPEDWKKIQVPLGLAAAIIIACIGAYAYMHTEFVLAADFRQYQQSREIRDLERDKKQVELEVLKLSVKKEAYPHKFDAVDRAILQKQQADLKEINAQIQEARKAK